MICNRCLNNDEEIDLLNVAFEQIVPPCSSQYATKRIVQESSGDSIVSFDVPDRLTGLSGVEELKKLNYARKWNFVQINVTATELQKTRSVVSARAKWLSG
jgi:hypothetical protein